MFSVLKVHQSALTAANAQLLKMRKNTFLWRSMSAAHFLNFWGSLAPMRRKWLNVATPLDEQNWPFTVSNSMLIPIFAMSSCFAWTQFQWIVSLSATEEYYGMLSPLAVFSSFLPSCKMLSSAAWSSNSNCEDLAVELINCCQTSRQILNRLVGWFHANLNHGLENQNNH